MIPRPSSARVVPVEASGDTGADFLTIDGRATTLAQDHLLAPFARLLAAVDGLVGAPFDGDEEERVREMYGALYDFFHALLPSASHAALDPLSYSVALLLVGEAIEAARVVADGPVGTREAGCQPAPLPPSHDGGYKSQHESEVRP